MKPLGIAEFVGAPETTNEFLDRMRAVIQWLAVELIGGKQDTEDWGTLLRQRLSALASRENEKNFWPRLMMMMFVSYKLIILRDSSSSAPGICIGGATM